MMLPDTNNTGKTRLNKKSAAAARLIWIVIAVFSIVTMIMGLPVYRQTLLQLCAVDSPQPGDCPYAQMTPADMQTLVGNGLTLEFYANTVTFAYLFSSIVAIVVAMVIFWKRSDDRMALLVSMTLLLTGAGEFSLSAFELFPENLASIADLFGFAQGALLILFMLLFPTGQFVPRWTRWIIIIFLIMAISIFIPSFSGFLQTSILGGIIWLGSLGIAIFSQVYRYFRVSTPTTRQQTKLIVFALAVGFLVAMPIFFLGARPGTWGFFLEIFLNSQFSSVLSIAFLISILRYRLWDIDFLINRTLVYGTLTTLLLAFFGISLLILTNVFQGFAGSSMTALAISAAIFGAVFQPIRRRLQRFVDQRLYHIQIDYQKTPVRVPVPGATTFRETDFRDYKDLELIGRGGMAEIYRSMHPTLHIPVAIKILPAHLSAEPDFRKRFVLEAKTSSNLQHENIVRVFDFGEVDDTLFMVMEFVPGSDLGNYLVGKGRFSIAEALPILSGVGRALDYAHSQGVIHRDIKPSNILLDNTNYSMLPKLTDFGIAKVIDRTTRYTYTGSVLGTFDYIAPEQIQGSEIIDQRTDIYALGIMTYQLITGHLPFEHANPGALLLAHLNQPPPDPRQFSPEITSGISRAIQQAMAKNLAERFSTAGDFMSALAS